MTGVNRSSAGLAAAAAAAALTVGGSLAGCPSTATTALYTPITGIVIQSSALVEGHGCGPGPDQVYRYLAVVSSVVDGGRRSPFLSNVFDCVTDGVFANLPSSNNGAADFFVQIFAYSRSVFLSKAGALECSTGLGADGGHCLGQEANAALAFAPAAQWKTSCTATQEQGVPVLAVCEPLQRLGGGPDAGTDDDVGAAESGPEAADVSSDADTGASADGG